MPWVPANIISMAQPEKECRGSLPGFLLPHFRKATMDNDEPLLCWIVDEEYEKLARQDYIEFMIAQEEQDGCTATANN